MVIIKEWLKPLKQLDNNLVGMSSTYFHYMILGVETTLTLKLGNVSHPFRKWNSWQKIGNVLLECVFLRFWDPHLFRGAKKDMKHYIMKIFDEEANIVVFF